MGSIFLPFCRQPPHVILMGKARSHPAPGLSVGQASPLGRRLAMAQGRIAFVSYGPAVHLRSLRTPPRGDALSVSCRAVSSARGDLHPRTKHTPKRTTATLQRGLEHQRPPLRLADAACRRAWPGMIRGQSSNVGRRRAVRSWQSCRVLHLRGRVGQVVLRAAAGTFAQAQAGAVGVGAPSRRSASRCRACAVEPGGGHARLSRTGQVAGVL